MDEPLSADYLVIGAGAMGMAFVDTLLSDSNKTAIMVDRYARPGGHWTIAYPYVRLHQPSAFYGVNSRAQGQDTVDQVGWNKGLSEMASRDEVTAYYNLVMQQTFLPSGRIQFFPCHEYLGEGRFRSILTGKAFQVPSSTKIVDATFMKVKVPSMGPPSYEVAPGVNLVTPNALPSTNRPFSNYTVIGAGKTGIDACLWMLSNGIDPANISWIMPRDSFYLERGAIQPGPAFAEKTQASISAVMGSIMAASSMEDLFKKWVACQQLLQLDEDVWPTMFRCATVSLAEYEQLKKIPNIIRKGRVISITADQVTLENGTYKPHEDTLYVDCSANALAKLAPVPIFNGNNITLQSVRYCQQVFSAAFIAHVETAYDDEKLKNHLCRAIPHPDEWIDFALVTLQSHLNALRWNAQPKTFAWLRQARLDWFGTFLPPIPDDPKEAQELFATVTAQTKAVCEKLRQLLSDLPEKDAARVKAQLQQFDDDLSA